MIACRMAFWRRQQHAIARHQRQTPHVVDHVVRSRKKIAICLCAGGCDDVGGRSKFAFVGRVKFDLGYEGLFQDGGVMNAEYHLDMLAM